MQAEFQKWIRRARCEGALLTRERRYASNAHLTLRREAQQSLFRVTRTETEAENGLLDALIESSRFILRLESKEHVLATWERATDYLRRLSMRADATSRDLPLPRILPAGEGSIDLLWQTRVRSLLLNFPEDENIATFFYKKGALELTGALSGAEIPEELLRWLIL